MTRPVHRRRPLLALVAVAAAVSGLVAPAAVPRLSAPAAAADTVLPYQDPNLPVAARVDDLLGRMTPAEKIGQMTQTERYQVFDDASPITTYGLGSILSGGGSTPTTNTPEAWADMIDRFQARRAEDPARHPAAVRHRLGPRQRQPVRRHGLPAQHRSRRDPQPAPGAQGGARHRGGDPRHRAAVDLLTVHLRRPRRSMGPHLRVVQREPGAGRADGDRDRRLPGTARQPGRQRPGARDREALRGRRRHEVRHRNGRLQDRPGHLGHQPPGLLGRRAAAVRACRAGPPRRIGDAVVLQRRLDRRQRRPAQDARPPRAHHRRAQGPDGLRRVRHQRLGGHPPDHRPGRPDQRRPDAVQGAHGRQRRNRHDDGAEQLQGLHHHAHR